LLEIYGSSINEISLHEPSSRRINGTIIVSTIDVENMQDCNVNSPLHRFAIDALKRIYEHEKKSWRNHFDTDLKNKLLKMMANIHGNNENRLFSCISRNMDKNEVDKMEVFFEVKNTFPGNPLVSGTSKWLLKKPLVNGMTVLFFFFMVINEALDIKLTREYEDWDNFVETFDSALNKPIPDEFMVKYAFEARNTTCSISANAFNCNSDSWLFENYWVRRTNTTCFPHTFKILCNSVNYENVTFRETSYPLDFLTVGYDKALLACRDSGIAKGLSPSARTLLLDIARKFQTKQILAPLYVWNFGPPPPPFNLVHSKISP
jgi:hypothetical protein